MSEDLIKNLVGKSILNKDPEENIVGSVIVTGAKHVQNLAGVVLTLDGNEESVYYLNYIQALELSKE